MSKLLCGIFAAFLFAAACSTTPSASGVPTVPASVADAAKTQLCSATGDASLSELATKLDGFDPATMDASEFQVAAGAVASVLAQLQVSGDQAVLRDAAVTAVQSLQGGTVDKNTATQAAVAIRALAGAIC
jgi:hypothetical protein